MITVYCQLCGNAKQVKPHKIKEGKGKFCSLACYNVHKKSPEHKAKLKNWFGSGGRAMKGKKLTLEQRLRLSIAQKESYRKGRVSGFKGKQHTPKEKQRRREERLGIPLLNLRGPNCHRWKGGITPINHAIRTSMEYVNWRKAVFYKDNYTCVSCGKRGGDLEADHIKPFALFPDLRFALLNGRTLCVPCHKKTPTWGTKSRIYARELCTTYPGPHSSVSHCTS